MKKLDRIISNLIYILILIPLIYIAISVVGQAIYRPEEIPSVFGYKMFMILDKDIPYLNYGDLIITKNVSEEELENGDIVAYRDILDNKVEIIKYDGKVQMNYIEGLIVKQIPKIGAILYFIQKPIIMATIIAIILIVGGICIFIAGKLDERELKKLNLKKKIENN